MDTTKRADKREIIKKELYKTYEEFDRTMDTGEENMHLHDKLTMLTNRYERLGGKFPYYYHGALIEEDTPLEDIPKEDYSEEDWY